MRFIVDIVAVFAAAWLLGGCPPLPGPSGPDPATWAPTPPCGPLVVPTTEDVCDGIFTATGLACVRCKGHAGCIDVPDQIYCVSGSCFSDRRCRAEAAWGRPSHDSPQ